MYTPNEIFPLLLVSIDLTKKKKEKKQKLKKINNMKVMSNY